MIAAHDFSFRITAGLALFMFLSSECDAKSKIEKLIEADNPCKELKSIGLDKPTASIDTTTITIDKDILTLNTSGRLDCRTSSSAVIKAHIGADLEITATADATHCENAKVDVNVTQVYGDAGKALSELIKRQGSLLAVQAKTEIINLCNAL